MSEAYTSGYARGAIRYESGNAARAGEPPARSRASSTRYGERPARALLVAAPDPRVALASLGGAANWLGLAAAPTFAIMALLTGVQGGGMPDMLCSAAQDASPLSGMVAMYLLMSAFHLAPWLKLAASRRNGARRS